VIRAVDGLLQRDHESEARAHRTALDCSTVVRRLTGLPGFLGRRWSPIRSKSAWRQ
jgi:hypothetical protein